MEVSSFPNDTRYNVTDNMTSLDANDTDLVTSQSATGASIASPIVMFLAGLIGNILALVVLHKTRSEIRSMMFYTLVAALTWNDLLGICLTSPPVLASYLNARHMPALPTLCTLHALAMVCFGLSTPFIVCAMAVERSLALKCCYFYSKHCTPHCARITVAALWAFVLVFGALPVFDVGSYALQYPRTWCFLDFRPTLPVNRAYTYAYALINLAVVAVMVVCNAVVMTTLCRVRRTRRMSNASLNSVVFNNADAVDEKTRPPQLQQHVRRRHQRDVELQMIWLLCAITTIFSVCWVPLMAYILYCLQSPDNSSPVFGLVAVRLASLNQTINPWIYVILRKSLLSRIRKLCKDCFGYKEYDYPHELPPRKPLTQYPRAQLMRNVPVKGRPNNYVHVRHQLCPSSQFVGQQQMGEGQDHSRSKGSGSGSGSRQGGGSGSQGSHSVCSVCRARMRMEKMEGAGRESSYSVTHSSLPQPNKSQECSLQDSPVASAECRGSSEELADPSLFLLVKENQARYFTNLPHHHSHHYRPQQEASQDHHVSDDDDADVLFRRHSGRREVRSPSGNNIPSFVSEVDDHGYSSKVSTDSSRMSTPERPRPQAAHSAEPYPDRLQQQTDLSDRAKPQAEQRLSRPSGSFSGELGTETPTATQQDLESPFSHDNMAFSTSGVFESSQDAAGVEDCSDDVCKDGLVEEAAGGGGSGVSDRPAACRTVSSSSAGARSESSSSQDRPTVIMRNLSSSSGAH